MQSWATKLNSQLKISSKGTKTSDQVQINSFSSWKNNPITQGVKTPYSWVWIGNPLVLYSVHSKNGFKTHYFEWEKYGISTPWEGCMRFRGFSGDEKLSEYEVQYPCYLN